MSTTMFIPMPEWQALGFLRDRRAAFDRLVRPLTQKDKTEVSAIPDERDGKMVLFTYRDRKDAVAAGYQAYPLGFAMVRIIVHPQTFGSMFFRREVKGESVVETQSHLYRLSMDGLNRLCKRCDCNDVEVMVDQIFPPIASESCSNEAGCCDAQAVRDQLKMPGPREVGMPSSDELDD